MDDNIQLGAGLGRLDQVSAARPAALLPVGLEWAAASLVLGAVFAVMVPPSLLLVEIIQAEHFRGFGRLGVLLAAVGGTLFGLLIVALTVTGLVFGLFGINAARREGRPIALGLAGFLLNGLDLLLWVVAVLAWLSACVDRL